MSSGCQANCVRHKVGLFGLCLPNNIILTGSVFNCFHCLFLLLCFFILTGCGKEESPPSAAEVLPVVEPKLFGLIRNAEAGNSDAQYLLGKKYLAGEGVDKDVRKALEWLQKSADLDHPGAALRLGIIFAKGEEGVEAVPEKAAALYQRAASKGDAQAQFLLGVAYLYEKGIPQNTELGLEWLMKAAMPGNIDAQMFLSKLYTEGVFVEKDDAEALNWLRLAAEAGHLYAQIGMGLRYVEGEGVERNMATAIDWFKRSAAQGHEDSKKFIGEYYADRYGDKDAYEWFLKKAIQGEKESQAWLGKHLTTYGDDVLAYAWLGLAIGGEGPSNPEAARLRWKLEEKLNREQQAEAKRLIDSWEVGQVLVRKPIRNSWTDDARSPIGQGRPAGEGSEQWLIAMIRSAGFQCQHVLTSVRYAFAHGYSVTCQVGGRYYSYELENKGGGWRLTAK